MNEEAQEVHAPPGRPCYRCDEFVRMSIEDSARWLNTWTICEICLAKLNIEAGFVGESLTPPDESKE